MNIYLSSGYIRAHRKIVKKSPHLQSKIKKRLQILLSDPTYSSLKLHKLEGKLNINWSISIQQDIRLVFTYVKEGVLLLNIGSHDEVY